MVGGNASGDFRRAHAANYREVKADSKGDLD
jgi:hypothetical protein